MSPGSSSEIVCATLERLGVRMVFGLPGSESIELFEALRRSHLRTILTTDERSAAFMANGHFRASGNPAVVAVIGGPGFTNALTGLAEAYHDSAGLLCLVVSANRHPEKKFQLQVIDHAAMAAPVVKRVCRIASADEAPEKVTQAYRLATTGEPGPVVVDIPSSVLAESAEISGAGARSENPGNPMPDGKQLEEVIGMLSRAGRVAIYAGQGAAAGANQVLGLAELLHSPVMTTCSGRGTIPENHPLSFYFDYGRGRGGETVNHLLAESDLVLALGCKFTHNGTGGFRLNIPPGKLIHVDASVEVLGANYPARLTVQCDVPTFLDALMQRDTQLSVRSTSWSRDELDGWHKRLQVEKQSIAGQEPNLIDGREDGCAALFSALRAALPDESCVVTDSGLHQMLTRSYFEVRCPRGMIVPTDFQSMGFGIPAAIGVKLALPERPVMAIVGDGGFAMSGMELATAVREKIPLVVMVFNDGKLGSIRRFQFAHSGYEHAVTLNNPDYADFAESLGIFYVLWDETIAKALPEIVQRPGVTLIEVPLADSAEIRRLRTAGRARSAVRRAVGPKWTTRLKKWLRR